jgi:hypothetical protein
MPMYEQRGTYKVIATPGRIVALAGSRVFVVSTKEIDAKQFPEPVHFEPSQDQFILPSDKPITIKCSATGGKSPLVFEIANDMPGLTIDSKTGAMTVDPAPFLARAGEYIQQNLMSNGFRFTGRAEPASKPSEVIDAMTADARAQFKNLTGQEAKGYPVAIPTDVSVRDDEQQTAVLNRVLLLDVPMETISKKIEQQIAQQQQQQAQYRAQREAMLQTHNRPPTTAASTDEVESMRRRISELEKRNTELEAQNKLLKELVGQSKEDKPKP